MKISALTNKFVPRILAIVLALLTILCVSFMVFYFLPTITSGNRKNDTMSEDRNYHVLVVGRSENESFLQQVYTGAQRFSKKYRTVVELYVPESMAEDVSLQSLFDYASFTDVDGVIAYIDSSDTNLTPPRRTDGEPIPLITIGHYFPDIPQVSFIGNNYSELGRKIANETLSYLNNNGTAFIISSNNKNNPNYSTLMNSLLSTLRLYTGITYHVLDQSSNENPLLFDNTLSKELTVLPKKPLLICLSAEDTIRAAQTVTELNKSSQIGIIGFGDNETIQLYFEKGIISELLSVNPEKIGETAIRELFEYRNNGYANSYITADVQIRKAAK
jgi:ribose transport system substrate-binding protein